MKGDSRTKLWDTRAKRAYNLFPKEAQSFFEFVLALGQKGYRHLDAKVLLTKSAPEVWTVSQEHRNGTYYLVVTLGFTGAVVVLHAFQTSADQSAADFLGKDFDEIFERLKCAQANHALWMKQKAL